MNVFRKFQSKWFVNWFLVSSSHQNHNHHHPFVRPIHIQRTGRKNVIQQWYKNQPRAHNCNFIFFSSNSPQIGTGAWIFGNPLGIHSIIYSKSTDVFVNKFSLNWIYCVPFFLSLNFFEYFSENFLKPLTKKKKPLDTFSLNIFAFFLYFLKTFIYI